MCEHIKYFRSQIIPSDRGTIVYWAERHDEKNFDIHESDIPDKAPVTDVTYMPPVEYVKDGDVLRKV